jgi:hypothetical protein
MMLPAEVSGETAAGSVGLTGLDVAVRVRPRRAGREALLAARHLAGVHERLLLDAVGGALLRRLAVHLRRVGTRPSRLALALLPTSAPTDLVLVHGLERVAHAKHELHELLLRELCVVDEVCVDHVLQVSAAVVRQQDVHCLGARVVLVAGDAVVDARDDVWVRREQAVGLDLAQRLRDRLLAKRAADLLEGVERVARCVLD